MNNTLTVKTSIRLKVSKEVIWNGITNSTMTYPKPICFNLGIPLPKKCEITSIENGIGTSRKCTSDHGSIEQNITVFEKFESLSFHMVSHDLNVYFKIVSMNDEFKIKNEHDGSNTITRITNVTIPKGFDLVIRKCLIARSLISVHRYVYQNIKSAQQGDAPENRT